MLKKRNNQKGGFGPEKEVNLANSQAQIRQPVLTFSFQYALVDFSPWWICNSGLWILAWSHLAFDGMRNMMVHALGAAHEYLKKNQIKCFGGPGIRTQVPRGFAIARSPIQPACSIVIGIENKYYIQNN